MLHVYEFEVFEDEGWLLAFPYDMEGGTQGADFKEVCEMAADWLQGEMEHRVMCDLPLPEATFDNEPRHGGRNIVVAVSAGLETIDAVTASEAADMLGVSRSRVSQMLKTGQLEGYARGRVTFVTRASVEARIAEHPKAGRPRKEMARA
ncbi:MULTISPECIES: helix-turn-helix domain-containing protein [unclassified Adlercreutzia]|uniref:helix-turn-helix domain-containing protein n=1 Tax=unclassified Adlercreutzia TaxID=2636013 RepID=UPI0013EDFE05|nr:MULTISPECIES: helix-turn-helix domain-containing protein [unclassified Adlercreutzia]